MTKTCPKCGFDQPDSNNACLRCGVIFAKIKESSQNTVRVEQHIKPSSVMTVANILGAISVVIALIFFVFYLLDHGIEYSDKKYQPFGSYGIAWMAVAGVLFALSPLEQRHGKKTSRAILFSYIIIIYMLKANIYLFSVIYYMPFVLLLCIPLYKRTK